MERDFGQILEQIFETLRNEVNSKIIKLCPNTIDKLYLNLENENPEFYFNVLQVVDE